MNINTSIKCIMSLTVGAAFGTAVTWHVAKSKYEKELDKRMKEASDKYHEKLEYEINKIGEDSLNEQTETIIKNAANHVADNTDENTTSVEEKYEPKVDYRSYYRSSEDAEETLNRIENEKYIESLEPEDKDVDTYVPLPSEDNGRPYIIDYPTYEYDRPDGYFASIIHYYTDGIYATEDDEVLAVTEVDDMIGLDAIDHFGTNPHDKDTVYIRNDSRRMDYELIKEPCSFDNR